jgi:hypothetical protein
MATARPLGFGVACSLRAFCAASSGRQCIDRLSDGVLLEPEQPAPQLLQLVASPADQATANACHRMGVLAGEVHASPPARVVKVPTVTVDLQPVAVGAKPLTTSICVQVSRSAPPSVRARRPRPRS